MEWAEQVIKGLSGTREAIPFHKIETDLPDVLDESHIETLLTQGLLNIGLPTRIIKAPCC